VLEFSQMELAAEQFAGFVKIYSVQCLLCFEFLSESHLFFRLNIERLNFSDVDIFFQVLPYSDVPMQPIAPFVQQPTIQLHIPCG